MRIPDQLSPLQSVQHASVASFLIISCFAVFLVICADPIRSQAQDLFIDPQFEVEVTRGIVYGTAPIMDPPCEFELMLDLYEPIGPDAPALRPGFIAIHGGGFWTGSRSDYSIARLATEMASRGYTAVSIDYRLDGQQPVISEEFMPLYDDIFAIEESPLSDAMTAAVEDATHAYRWLVANADWLKVDTSRIAEGGSSAGAFTCLMMAYGLNNHGMITDLPEIGALMELSGWLGPFVQDLEHGESPLVIIHGTADQSVPFSEAQALADRATETGVPNVFLPVEGGGHGFTDIDIFTIEVEPGVTLFDRTLLFFYDQLTLNSISDLVPVRRFRYYISN